MDLTAFPPVRGYLNTATVGIPPLAAIEAVRRHVATWAAGELFGPDGDTTVERSRRAFATLVGSAPEHVAQAGQVSSLVGLVAASRPRGARVLVAENDFTSVLFPFAAQDLDVRAVALDDLVEAIDGRTDLVAVSSVQSADGALVDLDALVEAADHHGADVLLDHTQGLGWLPVDARRFAHVVAGAYKGGLSPRGTALMAVRPDALERIRPAHAGWFAATDPWAAVYGLPLRLADTAKRLDLSPAWVAWAGTAPALEWLVDTGVDALHAHALDLAGRLRAGLDRPPARTSFVVVDAPGAEQRLAAAGVKAAVRAGRVRMSCHVPAVAADVDLALDALIG